LPRWQVFLFFRISLDLQAARRYTIGIEGASGLSIFMKIQAFSERTGISKSTLRYYESENLLRSERNTSGYRVYTDDQVATAKLISSLRLADVPIKDIQIYLREDDTTTRQQMMANWIQIIKKRRDLLNISLRYLESDSISDQIYLIEKSTDTILWYFAESETGKFKEHFIMRAKELDKLNIPIKSCYLKYLSGTDLIQAHIGFGVPFNIKTNTLSEVVSIEQMDSSIYIAMSFNEPITKIQEGYQKLRNYAIENEWVPTGFTLEWYRGHNFTDLDLLLPVTQIDKGGMGNV
jgi:DNA-binding transcriptional MerR regulator